MKYTQVNPKQSFPEMEEEIIKFWKEKEIFEKSISSRPESEPYRFYDGPPFITGTPHYGSLLSSVGKDAVARYWTMKWKRIDRVWWWDCHGIPIEDQVQRKLWISSNKEIEAIWLEKFTEECYEYTKNTSAEWEWYIDHIGRWVDFKNSYKTMDQSYMESVLWVFKSLYEKWLVYKWKRVSLYSTKLSTPISNFEVAMDDSYAEVNDPAITVIFDISLNWAKFNNTSILAWTTTPWTIPANIALAVNEWIEYSKVQHKWANYIVATSRVEIVFKWREYEIIDTISWKELVGLSYNPPFHFYKDIIDLSKNYRVYHADFITDEDGTGIAHQAPEFWDADFQLGKKNGLFDTNAIDNEWKYTGEITDYKWIYFRDANPIITDKLKELDKLFQKESITHRVAMCPRTWVPLIYKTQDSWFLNIQKLKPKLIEKNEEIYWFPTHLKHGRFLKSMESAPDWCLSRTRYWATPMPVWIWTDSEWNEVDMKIFGSIAEIEKASWMKVKDLHRPYIDEIKWEENWIKYTRVKEVLDVWLDSSSMPYAQVHYPFDNKEKFEKSFPADFIAEYIGQVRAWFYVMHVIGVALFDKPAYTNVITTWVLAWTDWRKMSKSYKNYPDPKWTMQKHGWDALRYYLLNSPLMSWWDISFNEDGIVEAIKRIILPFWNTYAFFTTYANIDNFEWKDWEIYELLNDPNLSNLDKWILSKLNLLIKDVSTWFEKYDIQAVTRPIADFMDNLTNWYIRRSRRRFWKSENDNDKLLAYKTLYQVLIETSKIIAPVLPFISEQVFKSLTHKESVHLEYFPNYREDIINEQLNSDMDKTQKTINLWLALRASKKLRVRQPLQSVTIWEKLNEYYQEIIKEELNVKEIVFLSDMRSIANKICKPNARLIWPRFWSQVQDIIKEAKSGNFSELDNWWVKVGNFELNEWEFEIAYEALPGVNVDIQAGFWMVIAMNTEVTEELKLEWYARDIVRVIQDARKESWYNVSDRILLNIKWNITEKIINSFSTYIENETLSNLDRTLASWDISKIVELEEDRSFDVEVILKR